MRAQFGRELALRLDRLQNGRAPFVERAQPYERLTQAANLVFVQSAGHLLAVTRDEGQRIARIEEVNRGADLRRRDIEFLRDLGIVSQGIVPNLLANPSVGSELRRARVPKADERVSESTRETGVLGWQRVTSPPRSSRKRGTGVMIEPEPPIIKIAWSVLSGCCVN